MFALCLSASAQRLPAEARSAADNLLEQQPSSYEVLHNALKAHSRDTLLLNYMIRESRNANYPEGEAYAFTQLGSYYQSISRYPEALDHLTSALTTATEAGNTGFRIIIHNHLGAVHRKTDAIQPALDNHQEALRLAETMPDPSLYINTEINTAINGIGNIYRLLRRYDLAIEYFTEALRYDIELGNYTGQAMNYQKIGESLEAQGEVDSAMVYYEKSLEANEIAGSEQINIQTKYLMAHAMAHQEEDGLAPPGQARELLVSVLPEAEALGDQELRSSLYLEFGWVLSLQREYGPARKYLLEGLAIAEKYGLKSNIAQANTWLHDISEELGDYRQALEYYKRYENARHEISNERNERYVNDMIAKSEADKRMNEIKVLSQENENVRQMLRRNRTNMLIGALLLALFILILYILYRQYQLNSERKVLTLEQSMLRSQMNPHFLFNSLNSIKLYIINNEQKNAVHYLNKFSKLVRKILEASSVREIALSEELETVNLYMNIENIRFNGEIDFRLNMDPDINAEQVKIPSLILQPFLENALWHGLSSVEGKKKVRIAIRKEPPGYITIAIRDNGIGREAAQIRKEKRVLKRKSVGISITQERLANFSKDYQNNYTIAIEDLVDPEGNPAGTEVVLQIPTI